MRLPLLASAIFTILFAAGSAHAAQPANTPPPPPPPPANQPPAPPVLEPIPVPDMPIVNKTELEGGIIAEDMKIGEGYEVKPGGVVVAHYHGTLKDGGHKFDSSFERGEPMAFTLNTTTPGWNGVIVGWQKGVPGMKVGGIRRLTIPSALGFGEAGTGDGEIPANADLVFIIQLVDALQVEDIKVGDGEAIAGDFVAVTAHTIKDQDGKELEKVDAAKPFVWLPREYSPIQLGLAGMKPGGKRKLIVPKDLNMPSPQGPSNHPQGVPVTIEVDLITARNLPGRGGR